MGKIAELLGIDVGKTVMAVVEMKIEEKFSNLVVGRRKRKIRQEMRITCLVIVR